MVTRAPIQFAGMTPVRGGQMVRAKVRCESLDGNAVKFATVYEGDAVKNPENARFTKATPWGEINLGIDNPAAREQFEVGQEYYVDFSPASSGAKAQGDGKPAAAKPEPERGAPLQGTGGAGQTSEADKKDE